MPNTKLPAELVSLVHHVELNKAGWWERGTQRLILAVVWLSGISVTPTEIRERLLREFRLDIDGDSLNRHIGALRGADSLLLLPNGQLKITESACRQFEKTIAEAEELETQARARFFVHLSEFCPALDREQTWKLFNEQFLWPLMREVGARTYQLITGTNAELDTTGGFRTFLESFPSEFRSSLSSAVFAFLDPKDALARSYVLRHLNAYFFLEAGSLERRTIEALTRIATQPPSFSIFVDTNFIFSILGLRENPSNEAANLLMRLISELKGKLTFRLYASLLTLDETKRSLTFHNELLRGLELTPNLAAAAIEDDLNGIARKYLESSWRTGHPVTADDYFAPYLKDLISILRSKNVEPYNERMDSLKTKQEIIDDILSQQEFERKQFRSKNRTPKTYEKLEHDIVLWHFVRSKRPAIVESPLEAQYWIVTVDYRLLGFDSFRTRSRHGSVPVCLHPTSLMQMLQFWLPRTPEFEEAMLGSLRWPFLIQEFDPEAERVTVQILQTLNRFENVGDLPKDVIGGILVNEALRQKLSKEGDTRKRIELVKEALIEENGKVREELGHTQREADRLKGELETRTETVSRVEAQVRKAEGELVKERRERKDIEDRLKGIEERLEKQAAEAVRKKQIRKFWALSAFACLALFGMGTFAAWELKSRWDFWKLAATFNAVAAIASLLIIDRRGAGMPSDSGLRFFIWLHRAKIAIWSVLGAVVLGLIIDGLAAWVRHGLPGLYPK